MKTDLKRIYSDMGKLKRLYFPIVFLSIISAVLTVLFALSVKDLINSALGKNAEMDELLRRSAISFSLLVSSILISLINKLLTDRCRISYEVKIKNRVFLSLIDKDYASITKFRSGDILSRVSRDSEIVANGITILPTLASMVAKIVLSVAVLMGLQPIFTLILLAVGLCCILLSVVFRKLFKKLHSKTRETDSRVTSFLSEGLNNIIALKVFSSKSKLSNSASELTEKYKSAYLKQKTLSSVIVSAFSFGFMGLYLATLVWGGVGLIRNDASMSVGLIIAMVQLISILQSPFANISALFSGYYEMLSSADRISEIEGLPNDISKGEIDKSVYNDINYICAENLSFDYGREKIFINANFSIKKGEICLIRGASGIGKSTLFKLLIGILNNFDGKLYFKTDDGKIDIDSSTRSLFSYVPQGNMLFYGSIKDNICMLNSLATEKEIEEAIDICALDFVNDFKDGLMTTVGEGGQGLSEGQAQRVAIARALLSKRPILLLDEATSALDSVSEARLLDNIKKKTKNMTVIMISHRQIPNDLATKVLCVKDNNIIEVID